MLSITDPKTIAASLKKIIDAGVDPVRESNRLKGMLADFASQELPASREALLRAMDSPIFQRTWLARSSAGETQLQLKGLARWLAKQYHLRDEVCQWVVKCWSLALELEAENPIPKEKDENGRNEPQGIKEPAHVQPHQGNPLHTRVTVPPKSSPSKGIIFLICILAFVGSVWGTVHFSEDETSISVPSNSGQEPHPNTLPTPSNDSPSKITLRIGQGKINDTLTQASDKSDNSGTETDALKISSPTSKQDEQKKIESVWEVPKLNEAIFTRSPKDVGRINKESGNRIIDPLTLSRINRYFSPENQQTETETKDKNEIVNQTPPSLGVDFLNKPDVGQAKLKSVYSETLSPSRPEALPLPRSVSQVQTEQPLSKILERIESLPIPVVSPMPRTHLPP